MIPQCIEILMTKLLLLWIYAAVVGEQTPDEPQDFLLGKFLSQEGETASDDLQQGMEARFTSSDIQGGIAIKFVEK